MNISTGRAAKKQKTCSHVATITINSAGLERDICETCGHVSFKFEEDHARRSVDRDQFARPIDEKKSLISF